MKSIKLVLLPALLGAVLVSCDSDHDRDFDVLPEVKNAFQSKYPTASNVKWEDKDGYNVADFTNNNKETHAWFDNKGTWYMTETDILYNDLPDVVKRSFESSAYATWKVDDVDMLEKKDLEKIYVLEVEQQEKEADLHYSSDGILIKTIADNGTNNYKPEPITGTIESLIKEKYPQARIVEIDRENNRTEVDIIHDGLAKEVLLTPDNKWISTSWEVRVSALPQAVKNVVNTPEYQGYIIDDADYVETPQGAYYLLEIEKNDTELHIKVDKDGRILN